MRRIAAHYVFLKELLPLHVVEITDEGIFNNLFPLTEEIAGVEFWDGVIYLIPSDATEGQNYTSLGALVASGITGHIRIGSPVKVRQLH